MARFKQGMAGVLQMLAIESEKAEDTAAKFLRIVKEQKLKTVEVFDEAVKAAYEANGWHTTPGRPKIGDERANVPHLVRTYVWEVRSAIQHGINVARCESFYELRRLRAKARSAEREAPAEPPIPELEGVRVAKDSPNGAFIHDLALALLSLTPRKRLALVKDIAEVLDRHRVHLEPPPQSGSAAAPIRTGRGDGNGASATAH